MKIADVRLRGRGFTLYPAAEEAGVSKELMDGILWLADSTAVEGEFPEKFTAEETYNAPVPFDIKAAVMEGLLEEKGGEFLITEKAMKVFEAAAKRQNKLDNEGFHFCPCHFF